MKSQTNLTKKGHEKKYALNAEHSFDSSAMQFNYS